MTGGPAGGGGRNKELGHEDIKDFFDEMSVGRDERIQQNVIVSYEQDVRSRTVIALLSARRHERVLDIGCGNARDIQKIAGVGADVTGVDLSEGMVLAARQALADMGVTNALLEVCDATRLAFGEGTFDKILCSEVIEHIPAAEDALREMWRVLKPGGRLVISTPNRLSWYGFDRYVIFERVLGKRWDHPFDKWRSASEVLTMLETQGFTPLTTVGACYVPGFLGPYFLLPRFLQRMLVGIVGRLVEPIGRRMMPRFGYMTCVLAVKPAS